MKGCKKVLIVKKNCPVNVQQQMCRLSQFRSALLSCNRNGTTDEEKLFISDQAVGEISRATGFVTA